MATPAVHVFIPPVSKRWMVCCERRMSVASCCCENRCCLRYRPSGAGSLTFIHVSLRFSGGRRFVACKTIIYLHLYSYKFNISNLFLLVKPTSGSFLLPSAKMNQLLVFFLPCTY
jgi:hypothetical protein